MSLISKPICLLMSWYLKQKEESWVSHKIRSKVGEYGVLLVKRQTEELIQWLQHILSSSVPWNVGNAPEIEFSFQIWYICWCDKLITGSLGFFFIFLLFIFYLYLGLTERRRALSSCPTSHLIGWVEMKCCLLKHIYPFLALLRLLKCLDACFSGQFTRDGEGDRHTGFYFHPSNGCLCLWSV